MLYIISYALKCSTWLCVTCVVYVLRSLCDATDAAVSGTWQFPPCFSRLVRLFRTYILFYISWDLCGYKNIQMLCRSACFKRRIFVCQVVCFFVLFMCFPPFAFDMSNCRGKTCFMSYTELWVFELWGAGFCSEPASPTSPQSGLPCGEGDNETSGEWQIMTRFNLLYHPTPLRLLVPSVLYPCEVLCQSDVRLSQNHNASLHSQSCPYRPTSTPHPLAPPVSLSE